MPFASNDDTSRWSGARVPEMPAYLLEAPFSSDGDAPWWVRENVPAEVLDPRRELVVPPHLLSASTPESSELGSETPASAEPRQQAAADSVDAAARGSAASAASGSVVPESAGSGAGLVRLPFGAALVEPEAQCPCCTEAAEDQVVPFNFHNAPDCLADRFAREWRLREQHTARAWRAIGAMHTAIGNPGLEFIGDDLALLTNTHPRSGQYLAVTALRACEVPELIDLVEAGALGTKHVEALLGEVDRWTDSPEQAQRVLQLTLDRCRDRAATQGWPRPAALKKRLQTAAVLLDLQAPEKRKKSVADRRGVSLSQTGIGAAMLTVEGPDLMVVQMLDAIRARAEALGRIPGDVRSLEQRMFDAANDMLTIDADGGPSAVPATGLNGEPVTIRVRGVEIAVLTPYSVLAGGELELAEVVGLGPILPSTARELLAGCDSIRRVAVDAVTGEVLAVDDKVPGPGRAARASGNNDLGDVLHDQDDEPGAGPGDEPPAPPDAGPDSEPDNDASAGTPDTEPGPGPRDDGPSGPPDDDPVAPASPAAGARVPPERERDASPAGLGPEVLARLRALINAPVIWHDLHSERYRVPGRLRRFVELRDRTCTFPGCTVPGRYCDVDHRESWPRGATHDDNCHCLCRRHHRAKQAYFHVRLDPRTGETVWTCPDGREYRRPPPRF